MTLFEHVTEYRQDPTFRPYHAIEWTPYMMRCACGRCWIMWGRMKTKETEQDQTSCPDHPTWFPHVVKMEGQPTP